MRTRTAFGMLSLALLAPGVCAQLTVADDRAVATDTPEAWAMRTFAGTTLMTSFGETAKLAPWRSSLAAEAGSIPHLSTEQQRVGFGGIKNEDLNKSPVIGRLRLGVGLPGDWVAELGYTPPLAIGGTRPRNLVALALGKRLVDSEGITLSARALGQVGNVRGDITCPARLAGVPDPERNPYGCRSASNDTFTTNYYGADATLSWDRGVWQWYASAGIARTHLAVQVDALVFDTRDRSRLTSNGSLKWLTAGMRHDFDRNWSVGVELLYVPLDVRRPPDFGLGQDSLYSARAQLRYTAD